MTVGPLVDVIAVLHYSVPQARFVNLVGVVTAA